MIRTTTTHFSGSSYSGSKVPQVKNGNSLRPAVYLRGHLQTDFITLNVIMTLRGEGSSPMTL